LRHQAEELEIAERFAQPQPRERRPPARRDRTPRSACVSGDARGRREAGLLNLPSASRRIPEHAWVVDVRWPVQRDDSVPPPLEPSFSGERVARAFSRCASSVSIITFLTLKMRCGLRTSRLRFRRHPAMA
jgi:hypothetical protein